MYRFSFEWKILEFLNEINCDFLTALFYFITEFGSGEAAIVILVLIYYCYDKELGKKIGYICINSMMLNGVFKSLFMAKRPFQYEGKEYLQALPSHDGATGTSFPSGHSQNTGALFGSLIIFFKNKLIRIISGILLVLIPLSRLYLGVHFPGDVVIGLLLGLIVAFFGAWIYQFFKAKGYSLYILYAISAVFFLPFIILNIEKSAVSDLFKSYGLYLGFIGGCLWEEKKVNFNTNVKWQYKIIRVIVGLLLLLGIKSGVKILFNLLDFIPKNLLDLVRYGIVSLFGIGIFPWIFKKYEKIEGK